MAAMFQSIVDTISGSEWSYAVVFGVALLDGFFPLVPSETTVIAAGVLAAHGDLRIELVLIAAAAGAICGDNVTFWLGKTLGERVAEKIFIGTRRRHLDRAHKMVEERGGYLIVIARFIPAGRTAVTFACGSLDWAWTRFIKFDVVAGVIWGSYASLLGYFGGKTFEDSPFKGFLVAFAIAIGITCGVEVVRWIRKREGAHS
ncbi:MAG TPA: DedA family protein [Gaiellaceae bacterium]|jgi:membrane protein DedA with SNARE-associated domain|nr:DedA family protein [Gaiellaceae bacterium]